MSSTEDERPTGTGAPGTDGTAADRTDSTAAAGSGAAATPEEPTRLSEGGGSALLDVHDAPPGTTEDQDAASGFQWEGEVAAVEVTAARDRARRAEADRESGLSPEPHDADGLPAAPADAPVSDGARTGGALGGGARFIGRLRSALSTQIERADERREAERVSTMRYDGAEAAPGPAAVPVQENTTRVTAPEGIMVRGAAMQSLPRWLVRGGLGAWLLLGIIVIVALVFLATSKVIPVFIGVFLALVITAILHPMVELFARAMPRYPATFLGMLVALAVVAGLITYVVTSVTNQWNTLALQFSDGINTILDFIEHGPLPVHLSQQELVTQVQKAVAQAQSYVQTNAPSLASEVLANAGTVADVFMVLALAIFTTIFFLASGGRMWRWFLNELPATMRERVHRAAGAGWYTFAGYARGTVILAGTDAVMAGIFLQIVGVPLAAPLAVLVFIGAFIPLIGAPTAMIVAMIVALAAKGFVAMVVVGLGVAGIGQIEGHILQPLIMGRQVSLHPVVVIIAVAVGTFSMGLLGAVIAVPLVSVAWSVYSELHVKDAPVVGELPAYNAERNA